ncbi:MAG: Gfo/Idh/MocA family oxidoreductase [Chthoniobacterales bacterium]
MLRTMNPLRCIMVGAVNRGELMINLVNDDPKRFVVAALVDKTAEVASAEAERRGMKNIPSYGSLKEAIAQTEADVAFIASPAQFHGQQIREALEGGLHVFVAKPMTYDFAEAEQLVLLAEKKKLCLLVDQQGQYLRTERVMKEWVKEKKYGEVVYVDFTIHRCRPNMGAFKSDNPFIWEQGVHSFNSLLSILDRPAVSVYAHQVRPKWSAYNGPTACFGQIEFEGGVYCQYLGAFESRTFTNEIRIEFDEAAVRAYSAGSFQKELQVASLAEPFVSAGITDSDDTRLAELYNFDAFYHGVTTGERVINDGRDNLRTLAIIDAFILSSKTGKRESVKQF